MFDPQSRYYPLDTGTLTVADGALTIRPRARAYTLEELLEQVTPENRHDEIDWGEPQGKEVW